MALNALPTSSDASVPALTFSDQGNQTLSAVNDSITLAISGAFWASVRFQVPLGGTAQFNTEISMDNGKNWHQAGALAGGTFVGTLACPFARKISAVSDNPIYQPINTIALTTGDIWEVALPSTATHFRLRCVNAGTASQFILSPGQPYHNGPYHTTLFDSQLAVNTGIDYRFDVSGWRQLIIQAQPPAGGGGSIFRVDDSGSGFQIIGLTASSTQHLDFSDAPTFNATATAEGASGFFGTFPLFRRIEILMNAVAALQNILKIWARR